MLFLYIYTKYSMFTVLTSTKYTYLLYSGYLLDLFPVKTIEDVMKEGLVSDIKVCVFSYTVDNMRYREEHGFCMSCI